MIETYKISETDTKYFISDGNNIISYVIVQRLYEVLDIINVFTEEKYRKHGYATKILEYILTETDAHKIMLEVNENNIVAINLYKRLGFKIINTRKDYYKDGNALIMEAKK